MTATTTRSIALVVLSTLVLVGLPANAQVNSATRQFLMSFTNTIPSLAIVWVSPDYCLFTGVTCDSDRGAHVQLDMVLTPGVQIDGTLPEVPSGVNGADIKVVELSMKGLRKVGGTLPASWGTMTALERLDLSNTGLQGQIPDAWSGMRSLSIIAMANSRLCMSLPAWNATAMPALRSVDFSGNNMRGSLSSSFGSFSSRPMVVNLAGNRFCGCIPSTWTGDILRAAAQTANARLTDASCAQNNGCTPAALQQCLPESASRPALPALAVVLIATALALFA